MGLLPESGSPALLVQLRTWRTQVTVWHDTCFWHLHVNSIVSHASSEGPGQKAVSSQGDPSFHSAAPAPKVRESPESGEVRSEGPTVPFCPDTVGEWVRRRVESG